MMRQICALLLAGGNGERLSEIGMPKQFYKVNNIPIIEYALTAFNNCGNIDKIVIVAPNLWQDKIPNVSKFYAFAEPGETRQHSIYNGLLRLQDIMEEDDIVVIHDAVRPLISKLDISECLVAVEGYDGAMPAIQLSETIYQSTDGKTITGLLTRDELRAGQTPEAYVYGKYLKAHKNVDLSIARGSSEIAFHAGMRIHLYLGNRKNIKITVKEDLEYFAYLKEHDL